LLNASGEDIPWTLPAHNGDRWECVINTADPGVEPEAVDGTDWTLAAHSSAVFRLL